MIDVLDRGESSSSIRVSVILIRYKKVTCVKRTSLHNKLAKTVYTQIFGFVMHEVRCG